MAIDRIGKGVTPPVTSDVGAGRVGGVPTRPFETHLETDTARAEAPDAAGVGQSASAIGSVGGVEVSPLDQLRGGAIDLNGYLDLKVDQATAHLQGLGPEQLGELKDLLRNELASDPGLRDLVQQSTGSMPALPDDE